MTESDYNTIGPVQNLSTLNVSNSATDSEEQKKRRNTRKRAKGRADAAEDGLGEFVPDTVDCNRLEEDTDGPHVDCQV